MTAAGETRRVRILAFIRAQIEECHAAPSVQTIADAEGLSYSSARRHLELLRDAGLVDFEDGRPDATLWPVGVPRPSVIPLHAPGGPKWKGWRTEAKGTLER